MWLLSFALLAGCSTRFVRGRAERRIAHKLVDLIGQCSAAGFSEGDPGVGGVVFGGSAVGDFPLPTAQKSIDSNLSSPGRFVFVRSSRGQSSLRGNPAEGPNACFGTGDRAYR